MTNAKPPARPAPRTGGGMNACTPASGTWADALLRNSPMMASADRLGSRRSSKSFRLMNIEPKFEPLADSANDCPVMPVMWRMPGIDRPISSSCLTTSSVRSIEAESGSWTATSR
jgi:hypothetical protein